MLTSARTRKFSSPKLLEGLATPRTLKHHFPKLRQSSLPWASWLAANAAPNDPT